MWLVNELVLTFWASIKYEKAVKGISSVFITFSLCKQKFIFVNNSLRPTFININFAPVDHKRKVVFWLCLIHAPERICPSNR